MPSVAEIQEQVNAGIGQLVSTIESQAAQLQECQAHECPAPVDNSEQIAALEAQVAELTAANGKLKAALAAFV